MDLYTLMTNTTGEIQFEKATLQDIKQAAAEFDCVVVPVSMLENQYVCHSDPEFYRGQAEGWNDLVYLIKEET